MSSVMLVTPLPWRATRVNENSFTRGNRFAPFVKSDRRKRRSRAAGVRPKLGPAWQNARESSLLSRTFDRRARDVSTVGFSSSRFLSLAPARRKTRLVDDTTGRGGVTRTRRYLRHRFAPLSSPANRIYWIATRRVVATGEQGRRNNRKPATLAIDNTLHALDVAFDVGYIDVYTALCWRIVASRMFAYAGKRSRSRGQRSRNGKIDVAV